MSTPTNRELLQAEWHALINDPEELLPVIRDAVESGTIKGEVQDARLSRREPTVRWSLDAFKGGGTYIVIGPVSDGGSET